MDDEATAPIEITEGQRFWYVPKDLRWSKPREVVVEKVGRKWATLANNAGRIDRITLAMDGGNFPSPGKCHLSQEHYENYLLADRAWRELARRMTGSAPRFATEFNIRRAAELLGTTLGVESDD